MAAPPRPVIRRPISITLTVVAATIGVIVTPAAVLLLGAIDLVTRDRFRRTRMWLLTVATLVVEFAAIVAMAGILAWHVGRLDREPAQGRFHRLEWWWAGRHITNLRVLAGVRWVVENPEELGHGRAIALARHASHADSILPVLLFGIVGRRRLRYTLKDDLQWAPAMDIVGNLLPNVFVDRSPTDDSPLWDRLEHLASGLDDGVAVIFPEGTFFTPQRLERAATRLGESRPDLEAAARTLEHMLPPRPAGTEALLAGAPDADIVLVAHEGMEAFSDLASIRRGLPLESPVRVRLWRIPRAEVPDGDLAAWLLERWIDLDRWIQKRVLERRDCDGMPPSLVSAEEIRP